MKSKNTKQTKESQDVIIERDPGLERWEHERIIIHRVTFKRIRAIGGRGWTSLWALYCFYYDKARQDETNQPWALDSYCIKGLCWSKNTFYKYKHLLLKHGFIEQIVRRNEDNSKIKGYYIKVNHLPASNKSLSTTFCDSRKSLLVDKIDTSPLIIEKEVLKLNKYKYNLALKNVMTKENLTEEEVKEKYRDEFVYSPEQYFNDEDEILEKRKESVEGDETKELFDLRDNL